MRPVPVKKIIFLGGGGMLLLLVLSYAFLKATPRLFAVRKVIVSGGNTPHLSEADIVKLSGVRTGANLFRMDLKRVENRLKRFAWVKEAYLIKQYPHRLYIKLTEYQPVAIVQLDDWFFVGAEGSIFKKLSPEDSRNFPVLTGLEPKMRDQFQDSLRLLTAFKHLDAATQFGISELNWSATLGYTVYTVRPAFQIHFGSEQLPERLGHWKEIGTVLANQYSGRPLTVDLTYGPKVYVKFNKHTLERGKQDA